VARFIVTRFTTVPHLEAVLLLRASPSNSASTAEIAKALYLPEPAALKIAESLVASGLLAQEANRYRYAPIDALAALMDEVDAAYATDLVAVTQLIHASEHRSAQHFADAFKIRKGP
jgi:DNA-binding IclR family transcriptional regulator